MPKILAALFTAVGLLACMYSDVLVEDRPLSEMSAAVDACIGFFVCVDSEVLGEVALLAEAFPAVVARVWA